MIIRGLRTSWAMTVDRRPRAESRSRSADSRWKRAIESVRAPKVRATSRASSSSQGRPGPRERPRSPVAAILFIASVRAASGRVTVRARAQLRSSPRPTATSAATARAARSAESGRSASARERRTRTMGAVSARAERRAEGRVLLALQHDPRDRRAPRGRPQGRVVAPRQRRGEDPPLHRHGHVAAGQRAQARRERVVEGEAQHEVAQGLGVENDRRVDGLEEPPALHPEGPRDVRPAGRVRPERDERPPLAVGQHEHVRAHPLAIVPRDGLGGAGIALGDRGLELRQVGHERGALLRRLEPGRVVLLDEARRLTEGARELRLRLLCHPAGGEAEGQGGGQDGHERRGREDARAEGAQGPRHHSTVKSCSDASPGAANRTSRRARTWPSFQTASVYVPGGTPSMR